MSAKTWSHVSPVTGVGPCDAKSKENCKFKETSHHFNQAAAARILAGRPANQKEHEAMRQHEDIMTKRNTPVGTLPPADATVTPIRKAGPKAGPKSGPKPVAKPRPTVTPPTPRAPAPFPTAHRSAGNRPQQGTYGQNPETLYHMDIGFPEGFNKPVGRKELEYSNHALQATQDDRYGKIPTLNSINPEKLQMVELGVQNNKVSKIVYRGRLDENRDMCIVVIPKPAGQKWFVKTVWINLRSDQHKTLDESKYVRPQARAAVAS